MKIFKVECHTKFFFNGLLILLTWSINHYYKQDDRSYWLNMIFGGIFPEKQIQKMFFSADFRALHLVHTNWYSQQAYSQTSKDNFPRSPVSGGQTTEGAMYPQPRGSLPWPARKWSPCSDAHGCREKGKKVTDLLNIFNLLVFLNTLP